VTADTPVQAKADAGWPAGSDGPAAGAVRRRFWEAGRAAGLTWFERVHGHVYARWPYLYIGAGIGARPRLRRLRLLMAPFLVRALFPRRWGAEYHGKVLPTAAATRLVQVREPVALRYSEQVIPFDTARDLVLADPDHIVALDCPCRLAHENPCLPLDVCLIVGEPFASFMLTHHPDHARAIDGTRAAAIIEAEADRGHVHHAFFKQAMLGRFYAICNCCSCCCGAMSAHRHGTPMLISSGYAAQLDPVACRGCGLCASRCQFGAIAMDGTALVNRDLCMGCGVCTRTCPQHALTLVRDASRPAPMPIPGDEMPAGMVRFLEPSSNTVRGGKP
jgi:ferredoxin